jgi:hypothetical protein
MALFRDTASGKGKLAQEIKALKVPLMRRGSGNKAAVGPGCAARGGRLFPARKGSLT